MSDRTERMTFRVEVREPSGAEYSHPIRMDGGKAALRRYGWTTWKNGAERVRVWSGRELVAEFPTTAQGPSRAANAAVEPATGG